MNPHRLTFGSAKDLLTQSCHRGSNNFSIDFAERRGPVRVNFLFITDHHFLDLEVTITTLAAPTHGIAAPIIVAHPERQWCSSI